MPRLLSQVLEHLGFPEEPRIERRISCTQVLSTERSLYMPISIVLQQQDQEDVADEVGKRTHRGEMILFLRWRQRWRGAQFLICLIHLHLHLPLPQPLLTLPALPTQHNSLRSIFISVLGSLQLLWMLSARLLLHMRRWTADGPSQGYYRAQSHHASSDHEPPQSPA